MGEFPGQLTRSSLGRIGRIGEAYDVRSESFSSLSLFRSSAVPPNLVQRLDLATVEFEYEFIDKLSDRFKLLEVGGEFQLSILLDLISVDGSGKFLKKEKKSNKTVSCSLLYRMLTVNEKFFGSAQEILQNVDLQMLKDPKYTHMVTEVNWGANCLMNLEFTCCSESNKTDIQGKLGAELTKLKITAKLGASLKKPESDLFKRENFKIKVFSDVAPEKAITTVKAFFEFLEGIPTLLSKVNEGKGKPLNYTMIPLSTLRELASLETSIDSEVKVLDGSFLTSAMYFLNEVHRTKRKLRDFNTLVKEKHKYVKEDVLRKADEMKNDLKIKEAELKTLISKNWNAVRSGKKELNDLMIEIETFKIRNLNLFTYEQYLDSSSSVVDKLSGLSEMISKGIVYLGRGEKFETLQMKYPNHDFIVLVTSSETAKADEELHKNTLIHFQTLAAEKDSGTVYVVADFDFIDKKTFYNTTVTLTQIFHIKGIRVVSRNLFAQYLAEIESDFVRLTQNSRTEFCQHKPSQRVMLEIPCPCSQNSKCSPNPVIWSCSVCKNNVEYGFNNFYYCSCGKSPADGFEYRCRSPSHGGLFIRAPGEFLQSVLSRLSPSKDMNVVVIGQSGVGKSTWINSIVNYLTYDSFDSARDQEVICTIPTSFTVTDPKTKREHEIKIGEECNNEVRKVGHSGTQFPRTYSFLWEGRCVRIIDTPGLVDSRGFDQDKENLTNIINHLTYLDEIHGICILIKASDNKESPIFTYCISQLLVNLHKNVAKNIIFCFTNSRTAMYSTGQASAVLKNVIKKLEVENELSLGLHNTFSLDNEAFQFLCCLKYTDIEFEEVRRKSYEESWNLSSGETKKLFKTIKSFDSHNLKETLSLVDARDRVSSLVEPIGAITKVIQMNVLSQQQKEKDISIYKNTLDDLQKNLTFTEICLESEVLVRPRTVCTSKGCTEYLYIKSLDVNEIIYKTHCHVDCYLTNVISKTTNNVDLKRCDAMNWNGNCNHCGCNWNVHMHLTYNQKPVEKIVENKQIKNDMLKQESLMQQKELALAGIKSKIENYKQEQEIIIKVAAHLGAFLKSRAIATYSDNIKSYLNFLIQQEENKELKTVTEQTLLMNLKKAREDYEIQLEIFQKVTQTNGGDAPQKKNEKPENLNPVRDRYKTQIEALDKLITDDKELTPRKIKELENVLYSLKLTGEQIRQSVHHSRTSKKTNMEYVETPIQICPKKKTTCWFWK